MDLQALGNIGEFVGAIGVIASLVYLARQIRAAKRVASSENIRSITNGYRRIALMISGDESVARIFRVGLNDLEALTPLERTRFVYLLGEFILHSLECKTAHDAGLMDADFYGRWEAFTAGLLNCPGAAAAWGEMEGLYSPDVVEALRRARDGSPSLAEILPEFLGPLSELPG